MPQGKLKTKVELPKGVKQKHKPQKKVVMRKGHMTIAPKKAKLVQAGKLKKNMEKAHKMSIEEEAVARASHSEARSLSVLKPSTSEPKASSKTKKK